MELFCINPDMGLAKTRILADTSEDQLKTYFLDTCKTYGMGVLGVTRVYEQVCYRLYRANKRVQDPDLDKIVNPHEVRRVL